jgi:hypothetical protein
LSNIHTYYEFTSSLWQNTEIPMLSEVDTKVLAHTPHG